MYKRQVALLADPVAHGDGHLVLHKEETGKDLGILNLATTLGQAITSAVKTVTGTFTAAFAISIVMALCAAGFVLSLRKVR